MKLIASDLREGNCVKSEPLSIPKYGIYSDGVTQVTQYGIYIFSTGAINWESLPMTEDWLLKFNEITKHDKFYAFQKGKSGTTIIEVRNVYPNCVVVLLGQGRSKVCQTVHEFQNFMYRKTVLRSLFFIHQYGKVENQNNERGCSFF